MGDSKSNKKQRKPSLTPEELLQRSFRAKCRFRALVRMVISNIYWLDDIEEQELGEDVQKNVLLITRKKHRKSLLTVMDKGFLNKPLEKRTEEEKQYLYRVIGNLKCFKKFQPEVKNQLAGVTYFHYYGPGRVIVRQGDPAYALYFILTGEVTVSQAVYDPILNTTVSKPLCTMGPGMMFGEIALLQNITRTATIMTNTHCELLCLKRSDFEIVLKQTVQEQWNEIYTALRMFSYFEEWDDVLIRECCTLARMSVFARDQTVLGDGHGLRNFVYFIIKGKCQIIEHLLVTPAVVNGKKRYRMTFPPPASEANLDPSKPDRKVQSSISKSSKSSSLVELKSADVESENIKNFDNTCTLGGVSPTRKSDLTNQGSTRRRTSSSSRKRSSKIDKSASRLSKSQSKADTMNDKVDRTPTLLNLSSKLAPPISNIHFSDKVERHFMQVCFLNPTACFGIGENMAHRRVIALAPTQCLLIPRNWLMQKNAGNIWLRVQQFLNNHIPTSEQVFKEFLNQRRWLKHREQVVNEVYAKRRIDTYNTLTNVPYFIRIKEQIDSN